MEIGKTAKMKNAEKRTFWQEQLAQLCSQIVSFSFFVFLKFCIFCWKHYKNRGFSKKTKKTINKIYKLKIGPSIS